jgi:hypothetical protein
LTVSILHILYLKVQALGFHTFILWTKQDSSIHHKKMATGHKKMATGHKKMTTGHEKVATRHEKVATGQKKLLQYIK